jgi:hypothetical protein
MEAMTASSLPSPSRSNRAAVPTGRRPAPAAGSSGVGSAKVTIAPGRTGRAAICCRNATDEAVRMAVVPAIAAAVTALSTAAAEAGSIGHATPPAIKTEVS